MTLELWMAASTWELINMHHEVELRQKQHPSHTDQPCRANIKSKKRNVQGSARDDLYNLTCLALGFWLYVLRFEIDVFHYDLTVVGHYPTDFTYFALVCPGYHLHCISYFDMQLLHDRQTVWLNFLPFPALNLQQISVSKVVSTATQPTDPGFFSNISNRLCRFHAGQEATHLHSYNQGLISDGGTR